MPSTTYLINILQQYKIPSYSLSIEYKFVSKIISHTYPNLLYDEKHPYRTIRNICNNEWEIYDMSYILSFYPTPYQWERFDLPFNYTKKDIKRLIKFLKKVKRGI